MARVRLALYTKHVKIALGQINPTVGDFAGNAAKIIEFSRRAKAAGAGLVGGMPGGFGIDVRNADGLIVISDMVTGFWAFHMDGFDGWNGHQWGMPNVSSGQDWDNGPEGAPKPQKVS